MSAATAAGGGSSSPQEHGKLDEALVKRNTITHRIDFKISDVDLLETLGEWSHARTARRPPPRGSHRQLWL